MDIIKLTSKPGAETTNRWAQMQYYDAVLKTITKEAMEWPSGVKRAGWHEHGTLKRRHDTFM